MLPLQTRAEEQVIFNEHETYTFIAGLHSDGNIIRSMTDLRVDFTAPFDRYDDPNKIVVIASLQSLSVSAYNPFDYPGLTIDIEIELDSFEDSFVYNDLLVGQVETIEFNKIMDRTDVEEAVLSVRSDAYILYTNNITIGAMLSFEWNLIVVENMNPLHLVVGIFSIPVIVVVIFLMKTRK